MRERLFGTIISDEIVKRMDKRPIRLWRAAASRSS